MQSGRCSDATVVQRDNINNISRPLSQTSTPDADEVYLDGPRSDDAHPRACVDRPARCVIALPPVFRSLSRAGRCSGAWRYRRSATCAINGTPPSAADGRCRTPRCMHVCMSCSSGRLPSNSSRASTQCQGATGMCAPARRSRVTFFDVRRQNSSQQQRRR
jgi:hypothetical protein